MTVGRAPSILMHGTLNSLSLPFDCATQIQKNGSNLKIARFHIFVTDLTINFCPASKVRTPLENTSQFHPSLVLRPLFCVSLSRLRQFSFHTPRLSVSSIFFFTAYSHECGAESFLRTTKKHRLLVTAKCSDRGLPRNFSATLTCTRRPSHRRSCLFSALGNVFPPSLTLHVAHHRALPVSTLPHFSSFSLFLPQTSKSSQTLQHLFALLSADSSTQIIHPPPTQSPASQDSAILSLRQQKEVHKTSFNEYRIALSQAEMKINEQAVCSSTVSSALRGSPACWFKACGQKRVSPATEQRSQKSSLWSL